MPVYVETLTTATAQDAIDLAKIYADAPAWLLAPYADAQELINAGLSAGTLVAGRFNDRLLGAALLNKSGDPWQLSHLCVRALTRKRGVARRLLEETHRYAREAGTALHLAAPADHLECQALAARWQMPLNPL